MNAVRSFLFMAWLVAVSVVLCLACLPLLALPRRFVLPPYRLWRRLVLAGFRILVGVRVTLEGLEKIPAGPVLMASKHQAMWDTIIVFELLDDPTIVLKQELMRIPVYGWYARKFGLIPVDRDAHALALRDMVRQAEHWVAEGRPVVIFPEGTRVAPGEKLVYKPGVAALYAKLGLPCVPVALNSGRCWPGDGYGFRPGHITLRILDPVPPGLSRADFMARLEDVIESASRDLAKGSR